MNNTVPVDHRIKKKRNNKINKYMDFARQKKKNYDDTSSNGCIWNIF